LDIVINIRLNLHIDLFSILYKIIIKSFKYKIQTLYSFEILFRLYQYNYRFKQCGIQQFKIKIKSLNLTVVFCI